MKASLKLREDHHHHHQHQNQNQNRNPLLRVKVPISILGVPFISSFTAGDPKDLSFNLHSNFFNGPSLKLSYSPNPTTTTTSNSISISLKSGVGLFGSPNNSPLIISAHFNLFNNNYPNPSFSLQIKPQFGDFFLSKTAVSSSLPNPNLNLNPNPNQNVDLPKENGGFPYSGDRPVINMRHVYGGGEEDGFFTGVAVKAKTSFPVAKFAAVRFRWGVNFPAESVEKLRLPFLTVDKISIECVEEELAMAGEKVLKKSGFDGKVADLDVLKGICFRMRKEVEGLQKENSTIKESLEEMKLRSNGKRNISESNNVGRKVVPSIPSVASSGESENWRSKKKAVEENARREAKKYSASEISTSDVGEELKRAIKAASSNGI
ncbi:hypothetical protein AQUCO_04400106v1 [Aquilegia coerulea]|uniref:Uncharacterized protein n=1 Tax=Aquilegia coerulea TaxID=218851 RepID=A0A2G5CNB8_AQUCA|nr:hypothetical protein AQUCO_04400106v1 [Aquilegia coerulea]